MAETEGRRLANEKLRLEQPTIADRADAELAAVRAQTEEALARTTERRDKITFDAETRELRKRELLADVTGRETSGELNKARADALKIEIANAPLRNELELRDLRNKTTLYPIQTEQGATIFVSGDVAAQHDTAIQRGNRAEANALANRAAIQQRFEETQKTVQANLAIRKEASAQKRLSDAIEAKRFLLIAKEGKSNEITHTTAAPFVDQYNANSNDTSVWIFHNKKVDEYPLPQGKSPAGRLTAAQIYEAAAAASMSVKQFLETVLYPQLRVDDPKTGQKVEVKPPWLR